MMFEPQLAPTAKASLAEVLKIEWAPYFNMGTTGSHPDHGFGGLLVMEDSDGSGTGKGTLTWGGGINTAWFIDPTNEIAGFLSLQLGISADAEKGLELKAVFSRGLKEVLA
jgi:CubicO group peptidase (beta-lactamase class C family)